MMEVTPFRKDGSSHFSYRIGLEPNEFFTIKVAGRPTFLVKIIIVTLDGENPRFVFYGGCTSSHQMFPLAFTNPDEVRGLPATVADKVTEIILQRLGRDRAHMRHRGYRRRSSKKRP